MFASKASSTFRTTVLFLRLNSNGTRLSFRPGCASYGYIACAGIQNPLVVHMLKRATTAPNPSPFVVKLETYLRMAGIPYQANFKTPFGERRKTPWITYNGKDMSDTELCIEFLNKQFNLDFSKGLSESDRACLRAMQVMTEEHLFWLVVLWRFVFDKEQSYRTLIPGGFADHETMVKHITKQTIAQGSGRYTQDEVMHFAKQDVQALSTYLGKKLFFSGDSPSEFDCAIFGHLSQFVWIAPNSPAEVWMNDEFPNLKEFCHRMKDRFWPDWDQVCGSNDESVVHHVVSK